MYVHLFWCCIRVYVYNTDSAMNNADSDNDSSSSSDSDTDRDSDRDSEDDSDYDEYGYYTGGGGGGWGTYGRCYNCGTFTTCTYILLWLF